MKTITDLTDQYASIFKELALPPLQVRDAVSFMSENDGGNSLIHALNGEIMMAVRSIIRDFISTSKLFDQVTAEHAKTQADLMIATDQRHQYRLAMDSAIGDKQVLKETVIQRDLTIRLLNTRNEQLIGANTTLQGEIAVLQNQVNNLNSLVETMSARNIRASKKKIKNDVKLVKVKRTVENNTPIWIDGDIQTVFYDFADGNSMSDTQGRNMRHELESKGSFMYEDGAGGMHRITLKPARVKKEVQPQPAYTPPWWLEKISKMLENGGDCDFTRDECLEHGKTVEQMYGRISTFIYSRNQILKNTFPNERRRFHQHWLPWSNHTKFTVSYYNRPVNKI